MEKQIEEDRQAQQQLQDKIEGILKERELENKHQLAHGMAEMGKLRSQLEKVMQEKRSPESEEEMKRMKAEVETLKNEVEHAKRKRAGKSLIILDGVQNRLMYTAPEDDDFFSGLFKLVKNVLFRL